MAKRKRLRRGEANCLRRAAASKRAGPYARFLRSLADTQAALVEHLARAKECPSGWQAAYFDRVDECLQNWELAPFWRWLSQIHGIFSSDRFWHIRQLDIDDTIWLAAEPITDPIRWVTGEVIGGPSEVSVLVRWPMVPGTYVGNYPEALCSKESLLYVRPRVRRLRKRDKPIA